MTTRLERDFEMERRIERERHIEMERRFDTERTERRFEMERIASGQKIGLIFALLIGALFGGALVFAFMRPSTAA